MGPDDNVTEGSGVTEYNVSLSLRDDDGSETYDRVVVTLSTAGNNTGSDPIVQFDTTTYPAVAITTPTSPRQFILQGSVEDLEGILETMQIGPGADNGEDITVVVTAETKETNPTQYTSSCRFGSNGNDDGIVESSNGRGSTTTNFTIEVKPQIESNPPTFNVNATAKGLEDTLVDIGSVEIISAGDADGSQSFFLDIRKDSVPSGTVFFINGTEVNALDEGTWLRVPTGSISNPKLEILIRESDGSDSHYSGEFNLVLRGTVNDETADDVVFSSSAEVTVPVVIDPVADCIDFMIPEILVNEDSSSVAVGANISSGLLVIDQTTAGDNNNINWNETIGSVTISATEGQFLTSAYVPSGLTSGSTTAGFGSASVTFTQVNNVSLYAISSTAAASADGTTSQATLNNAQSDILTTLESFEYILLEDSDDDLYVNITVTTIDINGGTLDWSESCNRTVDIVVRAVADVSVLFFVQGILASSPIPIIFIART